MIRWKRYQDWKLKQKLLLFSAIFILGSLFLVTSITYLKYTRDFESESSSRVQQIIEQVSFNIDTYLDDLYRLSLAPYINDEFMDAIEERGDSSMLAKLEKRRIIEGYLEEMMIYPRGDINRVFLFTDEIYSAGRTQFSVDGDIEYQNYEWYKLAMSTTDTIFVPAHMQQLVNNHGPKVFSIVKKFRSTRNSNETLGVIKVDANYTGIENISKKVNMGKQGGLFIIDNKKNMIYQSTDKLPAVHFFEQMAATCETSMKADYNGKSYLLNSTLLPRSNWSILAVNSLTELNAKAKETRNFGFTIALLCAVLAFFVLQYFLNKFLTPLLKVVQLMREVERGDLSVRFPHHRGDEVGYLGTSFNALVSKVSTMLEENALLIKQVYETELLQKEAQVQALHSQIKPHFIFNTLNMISLQMQVGMQDKAIDHINKLSSILRSMTLLDKSISLQREIELLNAYLSIQSSRYDGRLDYGIEIDPSLYTMQVPALLFQPLVENAVIHGCEAKREKTSIRICSEIRDHQLFFMIKDTGIGMDDAALHRLQHKLSADFKEDKEAPADTGKQGSGIGLLNVNKRIKLKYGNDYGLTVESSLQSGTTVIIALPVPGQEGRTADV